MPIIERIHSMRTTGGKRTPLVSTTTTATTQLLILSILLKMATLLQWLQFLFVRGTNCVCNYKKKYTKLVAFSHCICYQLVKVDIQLGWKH